MTSIRDSNAINRANWDERAPAHVASPAYAVQEFKDDPSFLSGVVRFDLPRLGDIDGLRGVHLQCHIGTDTISLARLGATMTGLDFSPASLAEARRLAKSIDADVEFASTVTHSWNHGLAEIVTAVMSAGLELTMLVEHDSVPWDALPGQMTEIGGGEFRLTDRPWRLPHSYTLQARKPD